MESLSLAQAQKIVLLSQKLPPKKLPPKKQRNGGALANTLSAIENLGYVQIDTISVIQRAHHHTLWNRNQDYQLKHLDKLLERREVFEYWSHAAAYLPMRDYRFSLHRKNGFASGKLKHWYKKDDALMAHVLKRIESEGPLMAKDFEGDRPNPGGWGGKPAKQALETLFMQGDLMVPSRVNFHKVYDLTERVLPSGIDTSEPTEQEYIEHLITRYLEANGVGIASEMSYLLKNTKPLIQKTLQQMLEDKQVVKVDVQGSDYHVLPNAFELLNQPLSRTKLKILSPFDNLLIQRKRMQSLFNFDYLLECYVPEAKRQFGYFSLPILWQGELVARMDCKVDRNSGLLNIRNLVVEERIKNHASLIHALCDELKHFMVFNQCDEMVVHNTTPSDLGKRLMSHWQTV
ncbi:winged helix DNA-binding domain-containing protein [Vibrio sp. Isolate34]|uniref:winged helix-turn-helix domain-containing protein n=1 Tax=Vibrio sp. Isolate34 TaxID=2908540 RepID=UPI001EFD9AA7|nr:crosslink repair DNA glycosylase YcaQ family protein [Vibrio sp. Isolate34]MCG9641129.1 winged helix DNA-binding domain-containing protein [Vibrio sp. Isolate34]